MTTLDYSSLCDDLQAEHDALVVAMAGLDDAAWDEPTPAPGWTVRDQIGHLAFFDTATRLALVDPAAFAALRREALVDLGAYVDKALEDGRGRSGAEMSYWFTTQRSLLVEVLRSVEPAAQVPWFGPSMSAASKTTARIMETWAHGQDVVDALGLDRPPTSRLRHVAHIGVRALPNSYRARGLEPPPPPVEVAVALEGPAGDLWLWGDASAPNRISGSAVDFCLVVTQRRHVADTLLDVDGPVAREWMEIAQAFAGPPGQGRRPGEFRAARGSENT